jgi:WD40 repeat protein
MARKRVVYVSSTFVDLEGHRAALKLALEKAQYDVECMETYTAFDERPLDKCRADVARADVYVLILAHRYGSRPKEGNPGRKSITQLEYEEAGRHEGKPRLVFTVHPDHPWGPKWIDKGQDALDLEAFRAHLLETHGINRFTEPDQLASLVLQALRASESGEARVEAREAAPRWNWPRPWDFGPYLTNKRRGFVGREWLFDMVRAWQSETDGPQALLLCADYGFGKSALMAELEAGRYGVLIAAHHFCHRDTIETLNPATFVRSVAAQLAATLPAYGAAVEADPEAMRWLDDAPRDPASAFERAVVAPLNAIDAPAAPVLLLVDALDEALEFEATAGGVSSAPTIVRLLSARAQRLPGWLKVLATSRRRQSVLQPLQQAFTCELLGGVDVRNLNDIRAYVVQRCASGPLSEVLAHADIDASELADFLSRDDQSGGKFLYVVRVLNDLRSGALPIERLRDLPPGMDGFYLDAFERRFPSNADYALIRPLLALLCAQREPLSTAQLAAISNTPREQVQHQLATLEDFLNVRGRRYALDHLSIAQWLTEENDSGFARAGRRFAVDRHSAAGQIADWARRELKAGRAHQSDYLARHLGSYLSQQERKARFNELLFDFLWLGARLRAAGISTLLTDWDDLDGTPALEALARALHQGAHVLGHEGSDWHGPDFLASQLLGRLQGRAEPEVRDLCARAGEEIRRKVGLCPLTPSLRSSDALLRTLEGHADSVTVLAVLPNGQLVSGADDGTIKQWNLVTSTCEATLDAHTYPVQGLAVLADGRVASGSSDRMIRIWNPADWVCDATFEGHGRWITALAALADGRLVSGSDDGTIKLWNPADWICEATLEGHTDSVTALVVLRDGYLASASADGTIRLWSQANGALRGTLKGHTDGLRALATLAEGRLASGSADGTIRLWNLVTGACEATLGGRGPAVSALVVLADGRLTAGFDDGAIEVWNPATRVREVILQRNGDAVTVLAALADGRLVSGAGDGSIKLWGPDNSTREAMLEQHSGPVTALAVLTDGRVAAASDDGAIMLWNSANGAAKGTLKGHARLVRTLAVLADGRLASSSWDGIVKLWNPTSGACETTLEGHQDPVTALAALADGRLAVGVSHGTIELWNPASGVCEDTLKGHGGAVTALAVLADGLLAASSNDGTIKLWSLANGRWRESLKARGGSVYALAALADGRLAAGVSDGTIELWNPASGACEIILEGHTRRVSALTVLADGRLVSGSQDKTIRIWKFDNQRGTGSVQFIADAGITALAVASDACVLAVGDSSGRVHFLKLEDATGS